MDQNRIPVIVGAGQVTATTLAPNTTCSPLQLMRDAAQLAAADSGAGASLLRALDSVAVIRLFADTLPRFASPFGKLANAPWSLARRIGADQATDLVYPPQGGDTPLVMLARACQRIAEGESRAALIAGGEALRTEHAAKRAGLQLEWGEDAPNAPEQLEGFREMYTQAEEQHGMRSAIAMYALIAQSLRVAGRQTVAQYRDASAKLFEGFAAVAKSNPLATRREGFSAAQIGEVSAENPYIGFPYTKRMIASAFIDQAAAFIVVSEALADELGIARNKRVYLHGLAHAHDQWFVSERLRLDRSAAARLTVHHALGQAGKSIADMAHLDIYSCFPSAVQIACQESGIAPDDPRPLTVTGGLPYFGGPGNNYVTHSIASMAQRLRATPGTFGLVTGNGGLLTKESVGVFSTERSPQPFRGADCASIQGEIDSESKARITATPQGEGVIETYTVLHDRDGPQSCVLFGRLASTDERFLANTPADAQTLARLEQVDGIGLPGIVTQAEGRNIFIPHSA